MIRNALIRLNKMHLYKLCMICSLHAPERIILFIKKFLKT